MTFLQALVIAVLFGSGAMLLVKRDLIRMAAGLTLISNGAILTLMAAGLSRGHAPIYPLPEQGAVSDPLVQALALTALVINFGTTTLLLCLVYRVFTTHGSLDQSDIQEAEIQDERQRGEDV